MIVTLAGHVDHGKTTLVKLLTGTDTDRLAEEQRRGLTIDLGFAYLRHGPITLGFVDVPGHHRFIHNMVDGVAAHQQAMLVVAADDDDADPGAPADSGIAGRLPGSGCPDQNRSSQCGTRWRSADTGGRAARRNGPGRRPDPDHVQ